MADAQGRAAASGQLNPLLSEEEIRSLLDQLADAVSRDHPEGRTLVVVGAMKGALVFLADLIRLLPMPIEIELLRACSYSGTQRGDQVRVLDDVSSLRLTGRHVLLLDTVLDSGRTLAALQKAIGQTRPASVKTCVLLSKRRARDVPVQADYVGRTIPDVFVVGYGLDHSDGWRHLPCVAQLIPQPPGRRSPRACES